MSDQDQQDQASIDSLRKTMGTKLSPLPWRREVTNGLEVLLDANGEEVDGADNELAYCIAAVNVAPYLLKKVEELMSFIELLGKLASNTNRENLLKEEAAWGLVANAYNGNWDTAPQEWKAAAEKWRDSYVVLPSKSQTQETPFFDDCDKIDDLLKKDR